ncbi:hypothetical protein BDF14DRAFT_1996313 [Spinellus fusiger]|nr:hypothetical protein BDF14DRAFT_1996313 [Spinellus fusiger]
MNLASMLNDGPRPTDIPTPVLSEEKRAILQMSATLHLLAAKDKKHMAAMTYHSPTIKPPTQDPPHFRLGPQVKADPGLWRPRLSLDKVLGKNSKDHVFNGVQLVTQDVCDRDNEPRLLLEESYEIQGSYSRGLFVQMSKNGIQHTFVFPYPDHPWFKDMHGLRKSAYINLRTEQGELWELHLKASGDKRWLFGYLCRPDDIVRIIRESTRELFQQRKLPLVLDLDDTLVRLVGENDRRHVPERELHMYGERVAVMNDGRKIVLTERVKEFLEWASNLFEISICSLGDQQYVENVVSVLDPQRRFVHGILYSARSEYDYIQRSMEQNRPPKNLMALYAFCELNDRSLGSGFTLPITIDDEERMWPPEQRENIIMVKKHSTLECWSVSLDTVVKKVLSHIHFEFFRHLDIWQVKQVEADRLGKTCTRDPPSALGIYKAYLRDMMADLIAQS